MCGSEVCTRPKIETKGGEHLRGAVWSLTNEQTKRAAKAFTYRMKMCSLVTNLCYTEAMFSVGIQQFNDRARQVSMGSGSAIFPRLSGYR